ncbi:MFS transporter [Microbacterium suwonense]|uniref:Major facilitator superfamily (MFS) profile domain-containing protein n=1 Tax=Microbacterium suwonense TaxID=683047 RepID=A0ABM8FUF2_9MICO|nr:MFS transporter [Microbacterium suwonense]BDZ39312.1 hypothetical protein GCM10025863_19260 [Microbacterium suwonense]
MTNRTGQIGSQAKRSAAASFVGGVMEFYDFFIYGAAAALVFPKLFFPDLDPVTGTLAAFATFGVAFLARPAGAVLFGHIGDRYGRKRMLVLTLWLMGGVTFCMGLLPSYAQVGLLAPVLLVVLRIIQGLAAGGELGGAAALAVEAAPRRRRGFLGAFSTAGTNAGTALGSFIFAMVVLLPEDQFAAWGWRIPFLASIVVLLVGFVVRRSIAEPEDFVKAQAATDKQVRRLPFVEVFRKHPKAILVSMFVFAAQNIAFYLVTVFSLNYAYSIDVLVNEYLLHSLTIVTLTNVVAMILWGRSPIASVESPC